MVTKTKYLVPLWYSGVALAVGLLIALFAIFGFFGVCRKNKKCWLTFFAFFTLLIFLISLTFSALIFKSEEAISAAESQNFVDIDGWEKAASNTLKSAVQDLWENCEGQVSATSGSGVVLSNMYHLKCGNDNVEWAEDAVNDHCFDEPVNGTAGSDYSLCYYSEWWSPTVNSTATIETINTDKGIFCQCSDQLVKWSTQYTAIGKWASLGVVVYFFLTLLAIIYMCCCSKSVDRQEEESMKGAFFARP